MTRYDDEDRSSYDVVETPAERLGFLAFMVAMLLLGVLSVVMLIAKLYAPTPQAPMPEPITPVKPAPVELMFPDGEVPPTAPPPALCDPVGVRQSLVRSHYIGDRKATRAAVVERVETYLPQIKQTSFFGLTVLLHERAHEPLACVEKWIRANCTDDYKPENLSGWRARHTYKGDEISNHVMGIAIDIDPTKNSCCGCQGSWAKSPLCSNVNDAGTGEYALPRCWIEAFERHGWYWLGCDPALRDTMHFEFLADPEEWNCP